MANCHRPRGYNAQMTAGLRPSLPPSSEWRRSGRYFLIAIALHLAALGYPLHLALDRHETRPLSPLMAKLVENVSAPQLTPPAMPQKPAEQQMPRREKSVSQPQPRPLLAMPAQQASAPSAFTVPEPLVASPATPTAPPSSAPQITTITSARFDAAYLHNPHPEYPPLSRRLGEEGKVLLKVRVTPEGRPAAVDLEKSSNFDRLDEAARQAVARWRFIPAKRGDEPIEASVIVPIVFRLDS